MLDKLYKNTAVWNCKKIVNFNTFRILKIRIWAQIIHKLHAMQ